jgi:anti-sigma regulatory factor (Ser/Thr protein kinase)
MPLTAMRDQSASSLLDRKPAEVRRAREETRKALFDWGLGEHAEVAELIVSEYVTNALTHGEGPIKVRISCEGGHLSIEVHDDGPGRPVRRPVTARSESGRGLEVVDGLLAHQGGQRTLRDDDSGAGKTVGAVIRLAGDR